MLLRRQKNIFRHIPLLKDNSFQNNIILILSVITFVVITIDLQTEMAVEKGEIFSVCELLDDSIDSTILDNGPVITTPDLPFIGLISNTRNCIVQQDILACLKDRAPPSLI